MQTLFSDLQSNKLTLQIREIFTSVFANIWTRIIVLPILILSLLAATAATAYSQAAVLTPREVVEYALTLEKLEAEFYRQALVAMNGGGLASMPEPAKQAIRSYGEDETIHVPDLAATLKSLGGNPDAITITANPNFNAVIGRDPFANPRDFLLALQNVEDTGVAAYKGQVQNLLAAGPAFKAVLAGALEIHTVEARHAAGVRVIRQKFYNVNVRPWIRKAKEVPFKKSSKNSAIPFGNDAFDAPATKDEVLAIVGPILAGK